MEIIISEFHFLRPLWLLAVPLVWWMVFMLRKKWWQKGDWDKIDPEPHAVVLFRDTKLTIPITDLELLDEDR